MGKAERERPARLAKKLLHIRSALGLSQNEMIRRMGLTDKIVQQDVSTYELDQREPPLRVLLEYAKAAAGGADGSAHYLEILIDDELDLPDKLPSTHPAKVRRQRRARLRN
jgi:transcriptional regulator with XRE-family HTH domain